MFSPLLPLYLRHFWVSTSDCLPSILVSVPVFLPYLRHYLCWNAGNVLPANDFQPYPLFVAFLFTTNDDISDGEPICVSDSSLVLDENSNNIDVGEECAEPQRKWEVIFKDTCMLSMHFYCVIWCRLYLLCSCYCFHRNATSVRRKLLCVIEKLRSHSFYSIQRCGCRPGTSDYRKWGYWLCRRTSWSWGNERGKEIALWRWHPK